MALGAICPCPASVGCPGWLGGHSCKGNNRQEPPCSVATQRRSRSTPQSMAPIGPLGHTDAVLDGRRWALVSHLDNRRDRGGSIAWLAAGTAVPLSSQSWGRGRATSSPCRTSCFNVSSPDTRNRLCNISPLGSITSGRCGRRSRPLRWTNPSRWKTNEAENWERNPRHRFTRCDP